MTELLTQDEIISLLTNEGFIINKRQIKYWRDKGDLPKLSNNKNILGYNNNIINKIRNICISKGLYKLDNVFYLTIEGCSFNIFKLEISKNNNYYRYIYYTDKGIIVKSSKEFKFTNG